MPKRSILRLRVPGNSKDRLDAITRKHAGDGVSVFPNRPLGLWIPQRELVAAARRWLGLLSPRESKAMLKPGVAMYGRHHAIQECLFSVCKTAGVAARKEVLIDSSNNRPADVYLPS